MKEKNEPLKELIKWMDDRIRFYEKQGNTDKRDTAVRFRNKVLKNIEFAVKGLLREIDQKIQHSVDMQKRIDLIEEARASWNGSANGLSLAKHIIKEWFLDVVEESDENGRM